MAEKIKRESQDSSPRRGPLLPVLLVLFLAVLAPWVQTKMNSWLAAINQSILRAQFQVRTIPNFLQDPVFLQKIQNDTLWRACDSITASGTVRFWFYPSQSPANIFEEIAVEIYKETEYWKEAVAFEYWCNIMEVGPGEKPKEHPWHTDRDEDVLDKEGRLVTPLMGAVFYGYNESYEGGEFHMINSVPYKMGTRERLPSDQCHEEKGFCVTNPDLFSSTKSDEALFVETKFNTLLFANVTHFHKVAKVTAGKRYALAVNANHWLPYEQRNSYTNDEIIQLARSGVEKRQRDFGLLS